MTDMTEEERSIWRAAYGAAFVAQFHVNKTIVGFDRAIENTTAEQAGTVADHAVMRFREWRENEDGGFGASLNYEEFEDKEP